MSERIYVINPYHRIAKINKNLYGSFAEHLGRCIYDGIYVGEDSPIENIHGIRKDIVEALRRIKVPVIRWPGGDFSDRYHWMDGVGPKEKRPKDVNYHWGGIDEPNTFGTHEFLEFCDLVGCEPYIALNVASGTVREARDWVEYVNADGDSPMVRLRKSNGRDKPWGVKYWGIGNESWISGGNMNSAHYANEFNKYQTFVIPYGDTAPYKIACGPSSVWCTQDFEWTETLLRMGKNINAISIHHYTSPRKFQLRCKAGDVDEKLYHAYMEEAFRMDKVITDNEHIMDRYDPECKIDLCVDEWGAGHAEEDGSPARSHFSQNSMMDAVIAGIHLNIFNHHARRLTMANIAQTVNVIQAVILTKGEQLLLTPTYHVFDMYKDHMGAELVYSHLDTLEAGDQESTHPDISESASVDADGNMTVTLTNQSLQGAVDICLTIVGGGYASAKAWTLEGDIAQCNTFDNPEQLVPHEATVSMAADGVHLSLPPCSVTTLRLYR